MTATTDEATVHANGSPSWKMIALALVTLAVILGAALARSADTRMTENSTVNAMQDREIARLGAKEIDTKERLERIEAKIDMLMVEKRNK